MRLNLISFIAAFLLILAVASCSKKETLPATDVKSITLDKLVLTLGVDNTYILKATVYPAEATNYTVTWTSGDSSVATVDENGRVTAVSVGTTEIKAVTGIRSASCLVKVVEIEPVPVESITLNKTEITLEAGNTETLKATVYPPDAYNADVTWASSDEDVATVTQEGAVTAVAEGVATITATAGGKEASCTVIVPHVYVPVASVTLNKTETTLEVGNTETLTATVEPSDADDPTVTWTSSDEEVATVTQEGAVTAIAEGTTTITATAGDKSAVCTVTVPHVYIPVASVTLNKTETEIKIGKTETLTATVEPSDADNPTVTWTSSDPSVASVTQEGLVSAASPGSTVITATADGISASCNVTVHNNPVPVTKVTLNRTSAVIAMGGKPMQLIPTIEPFNADNPSLSWTSSRESVATVSAEGFVTAVAEGTATITATSVDGPDATCVVTVRNGDMLWYNEAYGDLTTQLYIHQPAQAAWRVIGHRGAGAESGRPENSLSSLEYCRRLGLWGMECDILWTCDNHVIIAHGNAAGEVNGLKVCEHSLSEVRAAGTLSNGEQIPTLEDFITGVMVEGSTLRLLIDIKVPTDGEEYAILALHRACEIISLMNARHFCILFGGTSALVEEMQVWAKMYKIAYGSNVNWTPAKLASHGVSYAIRCTATQMSEGSGTATGSNTTIKEFTDAGFPLGVFHVDKQKYNLHSIYDEPTIGIYLNAYPSLAFIQTNYPSWLIGRLKEKYL